MQTFYRCLELFNSYGWFVLIALLERLFPARAIEALPRGWFFDLIHTYEPYVRALVVGSAASWLVPYAARVKGHGLLAEQPLWMHIGALVLVSETTFYFLHRLAHRSAWLWEFHRVHHSSTTYYSLMTSRFHVLDIALFTLPYVLITAWLGARPEALFGYAFFQGFMDRYGHSNIRAPRFTGRVIGSPHFHAWHHANAPEARGKNFSRDFVFMDYLMGTAYDLRGREARDFGEASYPTNYFTQQMLPFLRLGRRIARHMPKAAARRADRPA